MGSSETSPEWRRDEGLNGVATKVWLEMSRCGARPQGDTVMLEGSRKSAVRFGGEWDVSDYERPIDILSLAWLKVSMRLATSNQEVVGWQGTKRAGHSHGNQDTQPNGQVWKSFLHSLTAPPASIPAHNGIPTSKRGDCLLIFYCYKL